MDPKVHVGLGMLEAIELEQRGANAGERRDVKPYRAPGGALKGPQHGLSESNGRAGWWTPFRAPLSSHFVLRHALKSAEQRAAVSGEGRR